MNKIEEWVNATPKNKKEYLQEGLILDVTEQIWERMHELGLKKQDLAERLDCGKSHVTQLLNGSRNMTLRTLSDIAEAINCEIKVSICDNTAAVNPLHWFKKYAHTAAANQATHGGVAFMDSNIIPLVYNRKKNNIEAVALYG